MTALTKARKTEPVPFTLRAYKMKATTKIYPGGMVGIDASGWAVPADEDDTLVIKGIAAETPKNVYDNSTGANGDVSVVVQGSKGAWGRVGYWLANAAGGDAVTQAEVGRVVFVKDDQTVQKTSTGTCIAGKCLEVNSTKGVLVEFIDDDGDVTALVEAAEALAVAEQGVKMQAVNATLVAGTVTINSGITVTADSDVDPLLIGAITGSTNFASLRELKSSRVAGAPGVGTVVIEAVGADGAKDTDAAGAIRVLIFDPVSP